VAPLPPPTPFFKPAGENQPVAKVSIPPPKRTPSFFFLPPSGRTKEMVISSLLFSSWRDERNLSPTFSFQVSTIPLPHFFLSSGSRKLRTFILLFFCVDGQNLDVIASLRCYVLPSPREVSIILRHLECMVRIASPFASPSLSPSLYCQPGEAVLHTFTLFSGEI